ncbi:MAG: phosphoserine phosphatase SerB [Alphaproteobacteria bacterium]|nr:MAG: phosphoserine phosphatase SerB [Alphaproteobacteria bacterium]
MNSVLTLVADSAAADLSPALARRVRDALGQPAESVAAPDWLAEHIACDIPFQGDTAAGLEAARAALGDAPVDAFAQPAAGRRKRLLVADMDSTIVASETLDELAGFAGIKDRIAAITARSMNGEIDFATALRERVAMIAGLPEEALSRTLAETRLNPGARSLVRTMRAHGAFTALVSGGFRWFTRRIAAAAGFDHEEANDLLLENGRVVGSVAEPILGREAKLEALRRLAAERRIAPAETLAVGDGANDLPMLLAAGLGVAYRAKPVVAASVGCRVDHADLTALLYFQGYRRSEFVC